MITVLCSLNESNMATALGFLAQALHDDGIAEGQFFGGSVAPREALPRTAAQPGRCPVKRHRNGWGLSPPALGDTSPWLSWTSRRV